MRLDKALNDIFIQAEKEGRQLTSADYDAMSKLNKVRESIDKKTSLATIIEVFTEFNSFAMSKDADHCRANIKYQDLFINLKASGISE